jgi:Transposase and inactivated derivatives
MEIIYKCLTCGWTDENVTEICPYCLDVKNKMVRVHKCPRCRGTETVKNGIGKGEKPNQVYRCKECGRQFTASKNRREFNNLTRLSAILLYYAKYDLSEIKVFFNVEKASVIQWQSTVIENCKKNMKKYGYLERQHTINGGEYINKDERKIVIKLDNAGNVIDIECFYEKNYAKRIGVRSKP